MNDPSFTTEEFEAYIRSWHNNTRQSFEESQASQRKFHGTFGLGPGNILVVDRYGRVYVDHKFTEDPKTIAEGLVRAWLRYQSSLSPAVICLPPVVIS